MEIELAYSQLKMDERVRAIYMLMLRAKRISGHMSGNIAGESFSKACIELDIRKANGKPIKPWKFQP